MRTIKIILSILAVTGLVAQTAQADNRTELLLKLETNHLAIADTIASVQNKDGACGGPIEAYTMDIVENVIKARRYFDDANYNTSSKRKFKVSDEVTNALKTTLALKDIMNMLDYKDPKTFEHALNRVVMWGPAPGAYGNMSYIEFGPNNTAKIGSLSLLDEKPYFKWEVKEAKFFVKKSVSSPYYSPMIVEIHEGERVEAYKLNNSFEWDGMWNMIPVGKKESNPWLDGFVDFPSECEA